MSCLTQAQIDAILAKIDAKKAQLAIAEATYSDLLSKSIKSYKMDTSMADQWVSRVDLKDVREAIEALESDIERLYRKLGQSQVVNLRLRRR